MKTLSTILLVTIMACFCNSNAHAQNSVSSLHFSGTAKVQVPGSANTDLSEGSWGAWVKLDTLDGSTYQRIIYKESKVELFFLSPLRRFEAEVVINNFRYEVFTDSTTLAINKDQWYHIMVTYDTLDFKMYVNGNLEATNSNPQGFIDANANDWGIAADPVFNSWSFQGEIDEVTLWNAALTQSDVDSLLCEQVTATHPKYANLVAYYKFDENTGTTTADEVFANTGILDDNPVWVTQGMPVSKPTVSVNGNIFSSDITGTYYQWYFNGVPMINDTNQTVVATQDGDYAVEVTSAFGCMSLSDPYAHSTIGIDQKDDEIGILIYPNPTQGNITIRSKTPLKEVHVFDVLGKDVYRSANQNSINLSHLNKGAYYVRITDTFNAKYTRRLSIQ
jgi:hypothetical protein